VHNQTYLGNFVQNRGVKIGGIGNFQAKYVEFGIK
jgi:hypothetical protein